MNAEIDPAAPPPAPADPVADDPGAPPVDLEAIATDLADVEIALARLANGSYWSDEVTGAPLPDDLLAATPTARRVPAPPGAPPVAAPPSPPIA